MKIKNIALVEPKSDGSVDTGTEMRHANAYDFDSHELVWVPGYEFVNVKTCVIESLVN